MLALLFPGQGSQYPDMFARIASEPLAAGIFDEAQAVLGYDIRTRDDVVSLASTVNVQLGILVAGVASARILEAREVSRRLSPDIRWVGSRLRLRRMR